MPRKSRYPTPDEARRNYELGIEEARDKWVRKSKAGAGAFEEWFYNFATYVYPVVRHLPPKTGDVATNVASRVVPVAEAAKRAAELYRLKKIEERERKIEALARRAGALIPIKTG